MGRNIGNWKLDAVENLSLSIALWIKHIETRHAKHHAVVLLQYSSIGSNSLSIFCMHYIELHLDHVNVHLEVVATLDPKPRRRNGCF